MKQQFLPFSALCVLLITIVLALPACDLIDSDGFPGDVRLLGMWEYAEHPDTAYLYFQYDEESDKVLKISISRFYIGNYSCWAMNSRDLTYLDKNSFAENVYVLGELWYGYSFIDNHTVSIALFGFQEESDNYTRSDRSKDSFGPICGSGE